MHEQLYHAILDIWRGNNPPPPTRLASKVILIYKEKDPQDQKNYRPIYVSTTIYGILTRLLLKHISRPCQRPTDIQYGALSGRNTTTLMAKLVNNLHKIERYLVSMWCFESQSLSFNDRPARPTLEGVVLHTMCL